MLNGGSFSSFKVKRGGEALTTGLPAVTAGCLASSDCKLNQDTHTISRQLTNPERQDRKGAESWQKPQDDLLTCSFTRNTWSSSACISFSCTTCGQAGDGTFTLRLARQIKLPARQHAHLSDRRLDYYILEGVV